MDKHQLRNDITRIIILSHYEIECNQKMWDLTTEERFNFEQKAINRYQGKPADILDIPSSFFHNRVNREVAGIMRAIENSEMPEDRVMDDICLDCGRRKAHNADDVSKGYCPKWWAVSDPDAEEDCKRVASQQPNAAYQDTARRDWEREVYKQCDEEDAKAEGH